MTSPTSVIWDFDWAMQFLPIFHRRLLRGWSLIIMAGMEWMVSNAWKPCVRYHSIYSVPSITMSPSSTIKVPPATYAIFILYCIWCNHYSYSVTAPTPTPIVFNPFMSAYTNSWTVYIRVASGLYGPTSHGTTSHALGVANYFSRKVAVGCSICR
jgi:hypothetical protein